MNNMRFKLLKYLIFLLIFLVLLYFQKDTRKEWCYNTQLRFNSDFYEGIITKQFLDSSNHMYMSFQIKTKDDTIIRSLLGTNLMRELFSVSAIGDSIIKNHGENIIIIKRNGKTYSYVGDLNCDN